MLEGQEKSKCYTCSEYFKAMGPDIENAYSTFCELEGVLIPAYNQKERHWVSHCHTIKSMVSCVAGSMLKLL